MHLLLDSINPAVMNAAFYQTQFLDGRENSLENQVLELFINPIEHGLKNHQAIVDMTKQNAHYGEQFKKVFNVSTDTITINHVTKAIASFEWTLIAGNSPFDHYYFGMDQSAISASAARSSRIFRRKGNCAVS
jgi:cytochrome c peroxidase